MSYTELLDFLEEQEMNPILVDAVCGDCSIDDDSCEICPGHIIISNVDDQLCKLGLELMKTIAQEWYKSHNG